MSLLLGSLAPMAERIIHHRDPAEWWRSDWQDTQAFRDLVSDYLRDFLELGAGEELEWYSWTVEEDRDTGIWPNLSDTATSDSEPVYWNSADPDGAFAYDKNVLYRILPPVYSKYDPASYYENTEEILWSAYSLEDYSFVLRFENGETSIYRHQKQLDIYGVDRIYAPGDAWFVPGYENVQAGSETDGVIVSMAVRDIPVRWDTTGNYPESRMYRLYTDMRESRVFYTVHGSLAAIGGLLLVLWVCLQKREDDPCRRIAALTRYVWTELWLIAIGVCLFFVLQAETPAVLALFWLCWLLRNDRRHNPRETRRSLWNLAGVYMARYPFQRRMNWRNRTAAVLVVLMPAAGVALAVSLELHPLHALTWLLVYVPVAAAAAALFALWKCARLARDAGLLSDQVAAIRAGDLGAPLTLPADADLRQTAEALNDIQAGLEKALEERTHSERMKVELISNVSHDLKTPLTSILSYAELLGQEPLEGAAADYARIIDQKARRLAVMVQDVFDVSKAASGQLPVQTESLDLGKLLRQTLAELEDPIQASGLTFKTDLPESPVMISADGKRLYRVFQNLIQNALQYALPGSRVYLTLTAEQGTARAVLRNTSREELPEGVDFTARFVRGDESRTDGGSGLGLSIVRSFTEACGGTFRVESVADLFTAIVEFDTIA